MQFPVLCIPKGLGMYAAESMQSLSRCRASLFWRAHVYDDLRMVDSAGKAYVVCKSEIVRPSSKVGQAIGRFFETSVQVELVLQPIEALPMEELKAAAQAAVAEDPEAFEELSGRSIQWWNATLASAITPREVVNAFAAFTVDG